VIIALACVVVAGIGVNVTQNISGEVIRTGDVHQSLRLDNAIVRVTDVRVGTAMVGQSDDDRYKTGGMIVAVTVRVEAPGTKYTVGGDDGVSLQADGRTYSAFGLNTFITAEAGFASTGDLLFEVDPNHIAGAYLELYHSEFIHVTPQKVHIRLGITEQNAAQWVAAAKGRTLHVGPASSEPLQ
jgi:hypothetical protein